MKKRILVILFFIVVFGFPVLWYLFLQSFGENQFQLPVMGDWEMQCVDDREFVFLDTSDSSTQMNEIRKVRSKIAEQELLSLYESSDVPCGLENDMYLVDRQGKVRGAFDMNRLEVDRLMAEIDIYIMNRTTKK